VADGLLLKLSSSDGFGSFSLVQEHPVTEEKKPGLETPAVVAVPAAPQAIPALIDPTKEASAVVLSQAPPMTLTGPKPVVDKPTKVVASQFNTMK
jgi:hypothetical protein